MLKKVLPFLFIVFLISACGGGGAGTSDADMATRVASILTTMPSNTPGAVEEKELPSSTPLVVDVTLAPTATIAPTDTLAATITPIEVVPPTQTQTPASSVTPTKSGPTQTPNPKFSPTAPSTITPGGPTLTPPASDPALKLGSPTTADSMDSPDAWVWPTGPSDFTKVGWSNGSMWLTGLTKDAGWRLPLIENVPNMYIEMTASPQACVNGTDNYGVIFRVPDVRNPVQGYLFAVSCEGTFALWKWDGNVQPDGVSTMLIYWKANKAILTGANQVNRLGVMTSGSQITLYVNGIQVGQINDGSYQKGAFGVFVNPYSAEVHFTVRVDEMRLWHLP